MLVNMLGSLPEDYTAQFMDLLEISPARFLTQADDNALIQNGLARFRCILATRRIRDSGFTLAEQADLTARLQDPATRLETANFLLEQSSPWLTYSRQQV